MNDCEDSYTCVTDSIRDNVGGSGDDQFARSAAPSSATLLWKFSKTVDCAQQDRNLILRSYGSRFGDVIVQLR